MDDKNHKLLKCIDMQVQSALWECCPPDFIGKVLGNEDYFQLLECIFSDADAFEKKDPASKNRILSILQSYTSFKAILHYRIANFIYKEIFDNNKEEFALLVSNRGKLLSGADIHFKAEVGQSLVLDHGYNTVIGETSKIGNDCYILGGVTLGACGVANNKNTKRHPTIGNNVEIGAFSRILGNISIGDNVFIGSNCTIIEDVHANTKVVSITSNQITKKRDYAIRNDK